MIHLTRRGDDMQVYEFSDSVSMRLVQIFQEAMLLGLDGADLLRQVRLTASDDDPSVLVMTDDYVEQVKNHHRFYEEKVQRLRTGQEN